MNQRILPDCDIPDVVTDKENRRGCKNNGGQVLEEVQADVHGDGYAGVGRRRSERGQCGCTGGGCNMTVFSAM